MRTVAWFSCGAASAVATKLLLTEHPQAVVVRCVIDNEHPDNWRFADDCAEWFGRPIIELRSTKYKDCWDVWERERWLNGPGGARCTTELKKKVRQAFQQGDDLQAFGYTADEKERAKHFLENNLEVNATFPLIDAGLTKNDCYELVSFQGIELPLRYRLGYNNANCRGCVKGGMGYWNKTRIDDPEIFERMAKLERKIGASCINGVYLDELDPERGRNEALELIECGLFCSAEPIQEDPTPIQQEHQLAIDFSAFAPWQQ